MKKVESYSKCFPNIEKVEFNNNLHIDDMFEFIKLNFNNVRKFVIYSNENFNQNNYNQEDKLLSNLNILEIMHSKE